MALGQTLTPVGSPNTASDQQLLGRAAEGDADAFTELVRRYGASVLRWAQSLSGNATLSHDVAQQSLLSAYRGAHTYRGAASVKSWLFTITRNTARRLGARHQLEVPHEEPLLRLGVDAGWGSPDPEMLAVRAERHAHLYAALNRLAEADRQVILLRDIEQLSGPEAAELLGVSLRAMKSRLHRARLRLAVALR